MHQTRILVNAETGAEGPGGRCFSVGPTAGTPPAGRGGISGTVLGLEGGVLTVSSPRGELAVTLADGTHHLSGG